MLLQVAEVAEVVMGGDSLCTLSTSMDLIVVLCSHVHALEGGFCEVFCDVVD